MYTDRVKNRSVQENKYQNTQEPVKHEVMNASFIYGKTKQCANFRHIMLSLSLTESDKRGRTDILKHDKAETLSSISQLMSLSMDRV